ncbi:MAG: addiction module antitoxin [Chloroflexota bacterium]|nr:addiction module antitoxin [Chloroflexota bacterium]
MQRTLTITVDETIYRELHEQVGQDKISSFIEALVRPHLVTAADLEAGYRAMAEDSDREREAREWAEGLIGETL